MPGNSSTLKGRLFQEAKDRSTGDNALELDWFFFLLQIKSGLSIRQGCWQGRKGDGNSSSFQNTQLEEPEVASDVSPGAFMASSMLALAAPGDQAWKNCTAVVILCPFVSCSIPQRK